MSSLRTAVEDYMAMRRALGFKLDREEKLLPQFADYFELLDWSGQGDGTKGIVQIMKNFIAFN